MFTQITGLDLAAILDFDRRDIGADRADIVGDLFSEQRPGFIRSAHDRGVGQVRRPSLAGGAVDHRAIPGAVGGHHRGSGDPDFLLFERRGHSAASSSWEIA